VTHPPVSLTEGAALAQLQDWLVSAEASRLGDPPKARRRTDRPATAKPRTWAASAKVAQPCSC